MRLKFRILDPISLFGIIAESLAFIYTLLCQRLRRGIDTPPFWVLICSSDLACTVSSLTLFNWETFDILHLMKVNLLVSVLLHYIFSALSCFFGELYILQFTWYTYLSMKLWECFGLIFPIHSFGQVIQCYYQFSISDRVYYPKNGIADFRMDSFWKG